MTEASLDLQEVMVLALYLMAGEVASLLLSRVAVPVLYFMSHQKRHTVASSVVPSPAGALS